MIAAREAHPRAMRVGHGRGAVYRTTLLAKVVNLMVVKASLFNPLASGWKWSRKNQAGVMR